ncbi:hypothetical protein [Pseudomonas sp. NBRC 111128]|uniref:hypothetical protein n=1 Tax=Pseudomonas sp. NBRC 111128 TaxID=1661043 RepID=UPI0012E171ED|nr:hypothetical protein [Pseudomonas sp. NBRC 111128]
MDFYNIDTAVLRPELVVLQFFESKNSSRRRTVDVGGFCYLSRDKVAGRGSVGTSVDQSTLDLGRIPTVMGLVDYLRGGGTSSVDRKYCALKRFYDWIDDQDEHLSFDDPDALKSAYRQYTLYLDHLTKLARVGGGLSKMTAEDYQKGAAVVVSLAANITLEKVQSLAMLLRRSRGRIDGVGNISSQEERSRTFSALVNFISEVHRAVVLGEGLPLKLISPNDEDFFYYTPLQVTSKGEDPNSIFSHLNRYKSFPKLSVIVAESGLSPESGKKSKNYNALENCRVAIRNFNKPHSHAATVLVNRALTAGMVTFISASGTNLNVVKELEIRTEEVVPTTQGKRYSGTKGRAEGKDVYPEFGVDYVPVFKKIMELRGWLLNGRETPLVFPYQTAKGDIFRVESSGIKEVKVFLKSVLPRTVWVTPTQWRKGVGSEYIKLSGGDTLLTSEKLGNSEGVVRMHYARPSIEDTATELTTFFDSVYIRAVSQTRSLSEIPVKIIEDFDHPSNMPSGYCDKPDELFPTLADGFTAFAPMPSCGEPATCLFCAYFSIHADEQDIRRLVSLEYLLKSAKGSMAAEKYVEKFSPMIHRVNEVLTEISKVSERGVSLIDSVRVQVAGGMLDKFWQIHFNTFASVGVIS